MFIRNLMGPCIQAQEEAGNAFKKLVGPCTKPKRRLIEGPCYSTRESYVVFELILALSKWVRGFTRNNSSLGGCVLLFWMLRFLPRCFTGNNSSWWFELQISNQERAFTGKTFSILGHIPIIYI